MRKSQFGWSSKKNAATAAVAALGLTAAASAQLSQGPDVVHTDAASIQNWGAVGGIRGYSLGSHTCNVGNQNLRWGNSWNGTPALGMNAYRLHDGRIEQLGLSFVKYSCCAAAGNGCGFSCNGQGGSVLGVGCLDVYGAGYNGGHFLLGPRSAVNPSSGAMVRVAGNAGNVIFKRLQVAEADMRLVNFPGAQYFVEGVYVGSDDAVADNTHNNASYKRITINQTSFDMTGQGAMQVGRSAIHAWRDHGNGVNQPDESVQIVRVDVPDEGIFHAGSKAIDLGNGMWRYEYAVFNLSSHRSGGSFSVPIAEGVNVTNVAFNDVDYHSGEIYINTDWTSSVADGAVTWSSPETFEANANTNALRWGTMYNFSFEADAAPAEEFGNATIGLFRPGTPDSLTAALHVPAAAGCAADHDGDGVVNSNDFFTYLDDFFAGLPEADFNGDKVVNSDDYFSFLDAFFLACP